MYMNAYNTPKQQFDWVYVQTIDQVEQIAVQPTQRAWVMVQNEPVFAMRYADQMGLITTKYYRFEEIEKKAESSNYITRDELENILEKYLKEAGNEPTNKSNRDNRTKSNA